MNRSIIELSCLVAVTLMASSFPNASRADGMPTINLDLGKAGATVSPTFYGLMTEEINHS